MDDMNYPYGTSEEINTEESESAVSASDLKTSDREVIDKKLRQ